METFLLKHTGHGISLANMMYDVEGQMISKVGKKFRRTYKVWEGHRRTFDGVFEPKDLSE